MRRRSCRSRFPLVPPCLEMNRCARFARPSHSGTVLMPFTYDDGLFDGVGSNLPDCSMGLLNRACDWLARHPETRDVPASKLAEFSSDLDQAVQPLLSARIAARARKGGIRFPEGCGVTITYARSAPAAAPAAPSAHRTALYRLPALKRELRARDGDQCRYCARRVRWGAGQAADSGTWDWLEPGAPASEENVVTACKACGDAKAGRSLRDSGMTLLDPPPQRRDASCDASDLGEHSRDPFKRHRDASGGEFAGQKRHGDADATDRSRSHLSPPKQSKSKSTRAREPEPPPYSAEFRIEVAAEMAARDVNGITDAIADLITADVLGKSKKPVTHPLLFVRTAIASDPNPRGRWMPAQAPASPAKPGRPEWCGECGQIDRMLEVTEDGKLRLKHCPKCSGQAPAWENAS